MPTLDWIGKKAVLNHDKAVPFHLLEDVAELSCNGATSGNLIVQGDNLVALKSLLPYCQGTVKCIYIDPPYNTGNENWVYNDNVRDPAIKAWLGETVGKEAEDLSRHDKWLCMMYPRLKLLRDFLTSDGSIWVSIDDNECAHLRMLMEEIFGPQNFVADIAWQRTYSPRNDSKGIVRAVEHILVFSKQPDWQPNDLPRDEKMDAKYKNPDGDIMPWTSSDAFAPGALTHQGMVYAIQHPITGKMIYPSRTACWRYQQNDMLAIMKGWGNYELRDIGDSKERAEVCGCAVEDVRKDVCGIVLTDSLEEARIHAMAVYEAGLRKEKPWPRFYFTGGGKGGIRRKTYLENVGGRLVTNLWPHEEVGHTDEAKKELLALFGGNVPFDTPKPTRLIQRVIHVASNPGDLILDSFAGSGTTGHAVLKENMAHPDEPPRRFILVELLKDVAETVTAARVRKAVEGYSFKGKEYAACGGGFRYCVIGNPLLDAYGNIFDEVTYEQLARHVWFTETGSPMPSDGTITAPLLGVHDGRAIYLLRDKPLSRETLPLLEHDGPKVVYATAKRLSDNWLEDEQITFRQLPYDLKR